MPAPVLGSDGPQPSETLGYKLNHTCLHIQDVEATTKFYRDILGMRTIFTVDCGSFEILYFAYPEAPEETSVTLMKERHNRTGLIEFIYFKNFEKQIAAANLPENGFSHIGVTVPDLPAALTRLKKLGVTVLKDLGEAPTPQNFGLPLDSPLPLDAGFSAVCKNIAMVQDPNGFVVELMQSH